MSSEEILLLKRAQKGDMDSFEQLIEKYQLKAYNIAYRLMGNEEDAKDALQESFIKVYNSLDKFRGDSKFYTWVYRIVSNTCHDLLKKNSKNKKVISLTNYLNKEDGETRDIEDPGHTVEEIVENKEKSKDILAALNKLSDTHKEILIFRDVQGFSYEEIGDILNCTEGTVKSRISRARMKLKEIILKDMEHYT